MIRTQAIAGHERRHRIGGQCTGVPPKHRVVAHGGPLGRTLPPRKLSCTRPTLPSEPKSQISPAPAGSTRVLGLGSSLPLAGSGTRNG